MGRPPRVYVQRCHSEKRSTKWGKFEWILWNWPRKSVQHTKKKTSSWKNRIWTLFRLPLFSFAHYFFFIFCWRRHRNEVFQFYRKTKKKVRRVHIYTNYWELEVRFSYWEIVNFAQVVCAATDQNKTLICSATKRSKCVILSIIDPTDGLDTQTLLIIPCN